MEAAPSVHPVSVLRDIPSVPHSQWHPEPSPHVGDGKDPAGSGQVTGDHPETLT